MALDTRGFSHGRGGAGNMGKERSPSAGAEDLVTPTLKGEHYTTGRGGSGNMAKNDKPEDARRAQDVTTPIAHSKEPEGVVHYGRGGAANVTKVDEAKKQQSPQDPVRQGSSSVEGIAEKGKEFLSKLGLGGKK